MSVCIGQRLFPETGSHTEIRGSSIKLSWLVSKPQGSPCLYLPCVRIASCALLCLTFFNRCAKDWTQYFTNWAITQPLVSPSPSYPEPQWVHQRWEGGLTLHSSSWHFEEGGAEIKEAEQRKEGPHSGVEFVLPAVWEFRKFNTINQDCLKRL